MRVLICGTRTYNRASAVKETVATLKRLYGDDLVIITGSAPGADTLAEITCRIFDVKNEKYPAQWDIYGKAAGPIRNQQMLDTGIDKGYAFLDIPITKSKGTRDMVLRMEKIAVPVMVCEDTTISQRQEALFDAGN